MFYLYAVRCVEGPDLIYSGQENVEGVAKSFLKDRFCTSHSSPFSSGRLLDEVAHFGQGPVVRSVLSGNYEFPPEYTDEAKVLCVVAAKIYGRTAEEMIETYTTREDFQTWWLTANKDI